MVIASIRSTILTWWQNREPKGCLWQPGREFPGRLCLRLAFESETPSWFGALIPTRFPIVLRTTSRFRRWTRSTACGFWPIRTDCAPVSPTRPATWKPGRTTKRRKTLNYWLQSPPLWPDMIFPSLEAGEWRTINKLTNDNSWCTIYIYPEQENAFPWGAFAGEKMREFDGQNDSFLQRFLGTIQPCNIRPADVWFLHHNGSFQFGLHFLLLRVVSVLFGIVFVFLRVFPG